MGKNTNDNGTIKVTFLHPRDSREFPAEIRPKTTGEQALEGLVAAKFLEAGGAYVLQAQKTGKSIPLGDPIVDHGVGDGDTVAVTVTSAGAAE